MKKLLSIVDNPEGIIDLIDQLTNISRLSAIWYDVACMKSGVTSGCDQFVLDFLKTLHAAFRDNYNLEIKLQDEILIRSIETLANIRHINQYELLLIAACILKQQNLAFEYCLIKFKGRDFFSHALFVVKNDEFAEPERGYFFDLHQAEFGTLPSNISEIKYINPKRTGILN